MAPVDPVLSIRPILSSVGAGGRPPQLARGSRLQVGQDTLDGSRTSAVRCVPTLNAPKQSSRADLIKMQILIPNVWGGA